MIPIKFKGYNCVYAKNSSTYLPLPVWKSSNGLVVSCWKLTWLERIKLLCTGKMWSGVLTFNNSLQPQLLSVTRLFGDNNEATGDSSSVPAPKKIARIIERIGPDGTKNYVIQQRHWIFKWKWCDAWLNSWIGAACQDQFPTLESAQAHLCFF